MCAKVVRSDIESIRWVAKERAERTKAAQLLSWSFPSAIERLIPK